MRGQLGARHRAAFNRLPAQLRGALWMCVAVPCFASMINIVRFLGETQHPLEIVFFRNLFGLLALVPWLISVGPTALRTERLGLHLFRAAIALLAMALWFWSLTLMPVTVATALSFLAPVLTSILAVLVLGEPLRAYRLVAVFGGFAGALIIMRPGGDVFGFAALIAVATALVWAISSITVKKLSSTEPAALIAAYMILPITPISLLLAIPYWQWPDLAAWAGFVALGSFATLGHVCMGKAMAAMDAGIVVAYDYLRLPCVALIAWLAFGDVTDGLTWIGGILIALCGLYTVRQSARESSSR